MFTPFIEFAPAKINLALHVLGRRADGYHELDSIVAFADVGDTLNFQPADRFAITTSGPFARDLPPTDGNIISRVWEKFSALIPGVPPMAIHLTKNLPVASGIGGGSANAAATLRGLLRLSGLPPDVPEVRSLALALGADVPVCMTGRACRMRGVGERIEILENFVPVRALLANPGVPVSTAEVFNALGLAHNSVYGTSIADLRSIREWRNDLTAPATRCAPAVADVIAWLAAQPGATYVNMSGSGATCFALGAVATGPPPAGVWTAAVTLR